MGLPRLLCRHQQSRSCSSWPQWASTRVHGSNGGADASGVLRNDVYTHVQVAQTCGPPTILGGTQFVQVPHYEFAVPRTCEDFVVIAWYWVRQSYSLPSPQD